MSRFTGALGMFFESAKLWWKEGKLGLALAASFIVAIVLYVWLA